MKIGGAAVLVWVIVTTHVVCLAAGNVLSAVTRSGRDNTSSSTAYDPEVDIKAAKLLISKGKLAAAIKTIDRVLAHEPSNQKALLLKANTLRRQGRLAASTRIYRSLLNREDFGARLGLSYALYAEGNRLNAEANAARLVPEDDSDREEIDDLRQSFTHAYRPSLNSGCDLYGDSDHNNTVKCSLGSSFWLGNWKFGSAYQQTEAWNHNRTLTSEAMAVQATRTVAERFRLSGDVGFQVLPATVLLPMHFRADGQFGGTGLGLQLLHEIPTATVELIQHNIREDGIAVSISRKLFDRLATNMNYVYRTYSDHNNSQDIKMSTMYTIIHEPVDYALGYRLRFLDFDRQTGHGYFDPDYFISHELVSDLAFDRERCYGSIEWSVGHQTFERNRTYNSDLAGAATLSVGVKLGKRVALEFDGEGGNYALGSANGWEYYMAGVHLTYTF